jgi:nicotinic acid mononucleotide adenylyltransferase
MLSMSVAHEITYQVGKKELLKYETRSSCQILDINPSCTLHTIVLHINSACGTDDPYLIIIWADALCLIPCLLDIGVL